MSAKILISGLSNAGKTTLLKPLKNALVFARDGKPFSLELPHVNVPDTFNDDKHFKISGLIDLMNEKVDVYKKTFKQYPETLVFDSVSRIFTDIEVSSDARFKGFDVWKNVNKEISEFCSAINQAQQEGLNIVLIAHVKWDEKTGQFMETSKGAFGQTGGFLSTVDYAIYIDIVGSKRYVTHRGFNMSRTLLDDIPDKQEVSSFNLQTYLECIKAKSDIITEKWSI